jgi:hypothetical protein
MRSERTEGQINKKGPFSRVRARARGQRYRRCERRDLKKTFLQSFSRSRNVAWTCRVIGVSRNTVYAWMRKDAGFRERYKRLCTLFWPPFAYAPSPIDDFETALSSMSDRALLVFARRAWRTRIRY